MEFGKHIGKGIWAFADKALPAIYALGFIFLVVRVLPEKEYGAFALIQSIFLIVSSLGYALALQPLTKFAAETDDNGPFIVASLVVNAIFYGIISVVILLLRQPIASLLDSTGEGNFGVLAGYVPLLLLGSYYRSFAISLLQSKYQIQKIFWIDAVYFIGTFGLILIAKKVNRFGTAEDMILLNVYGQLLSSLLAIVLTRKQLRIKLKFHREAFRKMWDFGKYAFGGNANYNLFSQSDIFFVSSISGITAAATYGAAKNFTRIFDVVGQVIQMFLLPLTSRLEAEGKQVELAKVFEKTVHFASLLLVPVFVVMVGLPDQLLAFLYGDKYNAGSSMLRVFSLMSFIIPLNATGASAIMGTGKTKIAFFITLFLLSLATGLYSVMVPIAGPLGASIAYVAAMTVATAIIVIYMKRFVPFSLASMLSRGSDIISFVRLFFSKRVRT